MKVSSVRTVQNNNQRSNTGVFHAGLKKSVLIVPGHGGTDPGKVSGKNLKKEINLAIAQRLQTYLEQGDSTVFMTRADDKDLSQSKRRDMYSRKLLANNSKADIFVSIHQNSYHTSDVKGA